MQNFHKLFWKWMRVFFSFFLFRKKLINFVKMLLKRARFYEKLGKRFFFPLFFVMEKNGWLRRERISNLLFSSKTKSRTIFKRMKKPSTSIFLCSYYYYFFKQINAKCLNINSLFFFFFFLKQGNNSWLRMKVEPYFLFSFPRHDIVSPKEWMSSSSPFLLFFCFFKKYFF